MKSVTVDVKVENAYGKELPTPVTFSFDFEEYETRSEIPDGERLTDDQYVQAVNARRKANKRAKETEKQLKAAGIQKPDPNSPDVIREQQIKLIQKLHSVSSEVATQIFEAQQKMAESLKASA
jgi:hypothetical protein